MVGFKRRTLVGGELQVENYSRWLQMKNGGGFSRGMTVVSFRWRTAALGYRLRTQWLASNVEQRWALQGE